MYYVVNIDAHGNSPGHGPGVVPLAFEPHAANHTVAAADTQKPFINFHTEWPALTCLSQCMAGMLSTLPHQQQAHDVGQQRWDFVNGLRIVQQDGTAVRCSCCWNTSTTLRIELAAAEQVGEHTEQGAGSRVISQTRHVRGSCVMTITVKPVRY